MRYSTLLLAIALIGLLALGCAEKKDEAAKLAAEMEAHDSLMDQIDSTAVAPKSAFVADPSPVEATPEEEPVPQEPVLPESGFTVQVASCESLEYAQHLVELYTGRGYEPYLVQETVDGEVFNRVRIGTFEGLSEAKRLQLELKDKYSLEVWIDNLGQ